MERRPGVFPGGEFRAHPGNSGLIPRVSVPPDKRALFIICTSELGPQIYELVALTSSEKNTWMELLEQAVQGATRSVTGPPKRHHGEATTAATG
ncbi:PREDICTED: rho guanine nucleotide exchange factor 11-like [Corvus brachyrhynchos]|uniref:rho guanine nucleotide exchange factor 11-like n=1 Tax=Corvus brachyrhynchos TaxID=85066 RepID=UPI0008163A8B|nr:PREDICTED: rho guanine nucleotide exchange factor 11-like [Corvus brachyrhynchos]